MLDNARKNGKVFWVGDESAMRARRHRFYAVCVLCMAMAYFGLQSVMARPPMIEAPKDPVTAFARAYNVNCTDVRDVSLTLLDKHEAVSAVLVGLYLETGRYRAGIVPILAGEDRHYLGGSLHLIHGDAIELLEIIDLKGLPKTVHLNKKPQPGGIDRIALVEQKSPALLLSITTDSMPKENTLVLTSISPFPRILWQETVSSMENDGGGYETIRMQLERGVGEYLEIKLIQTKLPRQGETPYRPGPPLIRKFVMKDGNYQLLMK